MGPTLLTAETVLPLLKKRKEDSHKGDYGRALLVCGSERYRGAASLSAEGALRCGAGIVCLASVDEVLRAAAARLPEVIFLPLPENGTGGISSHGTGLILEEAEHATAILCGCGLTNGEDTLVLTENLLLNAACPLVLDADALNAIAEKPCVLSCANVTPTVTPHPGEMARLTGKSVKEILADPRGTAMAFSEKYDCVTVLKTHRTVVASPDGSLYENTTGNPGLARGGSGDILAGMITGFLAQGMKPTDAAGLAVFLHGLAADRTAEKESETGMLPSDIFPALRSIFREYGR